MAAAGEEPIQPLIPTPVTDAQYETLTHFISSLEGQWTGSDHRTECLGDIERPQTRVTDYSASGDISFDSGSTLRVSLTLQYDNMSYDDVSLYELTRPMLTAENNQDGSITTQARNITPHSAEIYFKGVIALHREAGRTQGVRPMEHVYELSRSGTQLKIERKIYLSGILVQIDEWKLRK